MPVLSRPARALAVALAVLAGLGEGCRRPPGRQAERAYDLVALLDLATIRRETRRVDLGGAEARQFLEQGWSWDEPGEPSLAWSVGPRSTLRFFLTAARDLPVTLRVAAPASPTGEPQRVRLSVNGRRVDRLELSEELTEHRLTLPSAALTPGWNRLELRHAHWAPGPRIRQLAARWDWIELGQAAAPVAAPLAEPAGPSLRLPWGTQLEYYLRLPDAARLEIDEISVEEGEFGLLEVLIEAGGGDAVQLVSWPPGADLRAALAPPGAGVARLVLRAIGPGGGPGSMTLRRPRVRPLPEAVALATSSPRPNVVVYLVDALRADRVGPRGGAESLTPNIDRLAEDGLSFAEAIAQSSWTKPAVASLFTGLLPPAHGVALREHALPARATTMAEALRAAGYMTAAFSTNPWVSRSFGLDQGFLDFVYLDAGRPGTHHAFSDEVNEEVFGWLDGASDRPFFLYVHTVDPHAPYTPPRPDGSLGGGEDPAPVPSCREQRPLSEDARRDLVERYDDEVAFNDRSFGRLTEELRRRGLYDDSLIVLLSDHGEAFWEHRGWQHENFLYAEVLDIPLIVKPPRGVAVRAAPGLAQQIDVLPTILDLLRLPALGGVQGRSLVAQEDRSAARPGYAELQCPSGKRLAAVLAGPWKLIRTTAPGGAESRVELYHRRRDPGELRDEAEANPQVVGRLLALLEAQERVRAGGAATAEVGDDLAEALRALGYVD